MFTSISELRVGFRKRIKWVLYITHYYVWFEIEERTTYVTGLPYSNLKRRDNALDRVHCKYINPEDMMMKSCKSTWKN